MLDHVLGGAEAASMNTDWMTPGVEAWTLLRAKPRHLSLDAEFAPLHRRMVSSFCTTDLTKVDPTAICQSRRDACMVRNAVCDSMSLTPGNPASFHCVCRPGSCAVSAGVCVERKCTKDVAKVEGALNAGDSKQQDAAIKHAQDEQNKLDETPGDKEAAKESTQKAKSNAKKEVVKAAPALDVPPTEETKTLVVKFNEKDDDEAIKKQVVDFMKKNKIPADEEEREKVTDGEWKPWTLQDKDKKPLPVEMKPPKEKFPVTFVFTKMKKSGELGKVEKDAEANAPKASEEEASEARSLASEKQPNMNMTFTGVRGIMPDVNIKGVSLPSRGQDESSSDYKIKFMLPSDSQINGAGGKVQIGSDDVDPAILDGLGKLTQKLEQAEKLQNTIGGGWDDVPAVDPANEIQRGKFWFNQRPPSPPTPGDVSAAMPPKPGSAKPTGQMSMPGFALVAASLSPSWGVTGDRLRRQRPTTRISQGPCVLPRRLVTAEWSAFLSAAS